MEFVGNERKFCNYKNQNLFIDDYLRFICKVDFPNVFSVKQDIIPKCNGYSKQYVVHILL